MYRLWCEMEQSKHDFYSSAKLDFLSMVDNIQFKSVKNMIIQSALDISIDTHATGTVKVQENNYESLEPLTASDEVKENNNSAFVSAALGLLVNICRLISDDYDRQQRKLSSKVDKKLKKAINRKKQELGNKLGFDNLV